MSSRDLLLRKGLGWPGEPGDWNPGTSTLENHTHRVLMAELIRRRYRERISLREIAERARVAASSLAATEAGESWPSYQVLAGYAACVGLRLSFEPREPHRYVDKTRNDVEQLERQVRDLSIGAERPDVPAFVRACHDLNCAQVTQIRTGRGLTIRDVASRTPLALPTVARIDLAPAKDQWVAYKTLLIASLACGGTPRLTAVTAGQA